MKLLVAEPAENTPGNAVERIIAEHGDDREVNVLGRTFTVLHGVFDPTIAPSGQMGMCFSASPILDGKVVADVGAGSGIFSCLFAYAGAARVIATDLMPAAICNIELNVNAHRLSERVEVRQGDGLAPITPFDGVDVIYCDFPFTDWREPLTALDRAFFDPDLSGIRSVISDFATRPWYAKTELYVCVSSLADVWSRMADLLISVKRERYLTVETPWVDLELWRLTR